MFTGGHLLLMSAPDSWRGTVLVKTAKCRECSPQTGCYSLVLSAATFIVSSTDLPVK